MLKALCASVNRFQGQMPRRSYGKIKFSYVVEVSAESGSFQIHAFGKDGVELSIPLRGDRSGTPADKNLKPYLLADRAMYALGIPGKGGKKRADLVHKGFVALVRRIFEGTGRNDIGAIYRFLAHTIKTDHFQRKIKAIGIKADDWIAFRTDPEKYFYDDDELAKAWEIYLEEECAHEETECCICGKTKKVLRIYPWQVSFMGYNCPISSFNAESFESFGQSQTTNSPTCFNCAGSASQVLQFLVNNEGQRYNAILSKDDARGEGREPLKNQLAVFWMKDEFAPTKVDETITIDFEELQKSILEAVEIEDNLVPPPHEEQIRKLCKFPWRTSKAALKIQDNAFYLAVISPNKSRLVLREWMEISVEDLLKNIGRYVDAVTVRSPDGQKTWATPIPAIFEALKPVKTLLNKKDEDIFIPERQDANLLRGLLRCCYTGTSPPHSLLERAVLRFRVFEREPEVFKQRIWLEGRRMALAAAIRLSLVHPRLKAAEEMGKETYEKEARSMEELEEKGCRPSYLCGRLLAVLEEIQRWYAFPKQINSTLVDRYYGAASTAPQSVFGNLLGMTTKAHMPKLRKERFKKHDELGRMLEDVNKMIMEANGFPKTFNIREQAEFALGFYSQRGRFRKDRGEDLGKP